jgi:hypothetical protein
MAVLVARDRRMGRYVIPSLLPRAVQSAWSLSLGPLDAFWYAVLLLLLWLVRPARGPGREGRTA